MEGARCGATTARDMTRTTVFDGEAARGLFPVRRDDECDGRSEVVGVTFFGEEGPSVSRPIKKGHLSLFFHPRLLKLKKWASRCNLEGFSCRMPMPSRVGFPSTPDPSQAPLVRAARGTDSAP